MACTQDEIRQYYDEEARTYDDRVNLFERLTRIAPLRRALLQKATGNVLEVAIGTGRTLPHYPPDCRVTGIDISPESLAIARNRAAALEHKPTLLEMDAQHLAFPDHAFDTIVSSLSLCSIPDPVQALREMKRVCMPHGKALLIQHGRSNRRWYAWMQDRCAGWCCRRHKGCHINRRHDDLLRQAGWDVVTIHRSFFGVIYTIEAIPSSVPS